MPVSRRPRSLRKNARLWLGAGAALLVIGVLAAVSATGGTAPAPARPAAAASAAPSAAGQPTGNSPTGNSGVQQVLARLGTRVPGDPLALGSLKAPVIMVEWADFQCPFCGQFARTTQPVLVRKYVDTGKLRIEWRDFPYLGPQSTTAAQAARAAAAQGRFWQYHDALYAHQHKVNSGALTSSYLVDLAGKLGLNTARFRADMTSPATARAVQSDLQEGTGLGINGTPAFLINGTPVMGAQPTATFEHIIDTALAHAR